MDQLTGVDTDIRLDQRTRIDTQTDTSTDTARIDTDPGRIDTEPAFGDPDLGRDTDTPDFDRPDPEIQFRGIKEGDDDAPLFALRRDAARIDSGIQSGAEALADLYEDRAREDDPFSL